jgi:predicted aspartyl protease
MKSPLRVLIVALLCFPALVGQSSAPPAALKTFLEREGYGGSPLQRRLGNHLFTTTIINGRRTALAIDTGCPFTLLDRASVKTLGLRMIETKAHVTGVTGIAERAAVANISTMAMGNCTFLNVPIAVADTADINAIRGPHLDGLFGAHEMSKFGAVIDCARQMLYVNPKPSASANQSLARFLAGRGFTRIPMRFDSGHHLQIDAKVNGHPIAMIVDTGAASTFLPTSVAYNAGASASGINFMVGGATGGALPARVARVQELALGDLVVHNAELTTGDSKIVGGAGMLGEEYLSWNFAIVDVGGMNLYLRPPESAPAKKR